ncbi:MAG: histone deacetylase [Vicinamibacterales bacterium]
MDKYARLRARVMAEGLVAPDCLREAPAAAWDELRLVHGAPYVQAVATGTLPAEDQRRIGFPWSAGMVERSRRSSGATIAAARAALERGVAVNLAGGTHHAFADRGEGYCVFNDVAIAARALQREGRVTRVAVVDCDVHQGNGTAAIFRDDPSVFTFSMQGGKNYPFRKERSDLDVELDDGTTDEVYLALLARHLPDVLAEHRPDLVFYLAGADPYVGDRLGRLGLTFDGLQARDRLVFGRCLEARVPVAVAMSGGYAPDVDDIVRIHTNTVAEAAAHAARWSGAA